MLKLIYNDLILNNPPQTKERNPGSQSQDFASRFTEVVTKPEFEAESEEPPPLVPPRTADSEVLNPSTGQPPSKTQDEVAYNI